MFSLFKRSRKPKPPKERRPTGFLGGGGNPPSGPDHGAVRAADPYSFEVAHRRLAWMFRLSVMTNVGLVSVTIVLAAAISTLVPLQKVELALVRVEPSTDRMEQVDPASKVRILPITRDVPGYDLAMESFVRWYTRTLLEIDAVSQDDRMRQANAAADPKFWERFMSEHRQRITDALERGLNRSVVIESTQKISQRDGVNRYLVVFDQVDMNKSGQRHSQKVHAYFAVASRPQLVRPSEKFENPLGLRVLDLSLKERGN